MKNIILLSIIASLLLFVNTTAFANVGYIESGDIVSGVLQTSDDQLDDDCYYDSWFIDCEEGQLLTAIQSSGKIDCYLLIFLPNGDQVENDDYSYESGTDSRVDLPITQSGEYEVMCSSYAPETGNYELTVNLREKPRYFGIFVGMDDYGWAYDNAPMCDEDAHYMYRTFIDSNLMDPKDGIELINHRARRIDLENAFHEIGQQIGPNDVFVFFYSGHGDYCPVSSRDGGVEIDGLDETLSLRDCDLPDNDLVTMIEELGTGLKMIVLDSCYSGGFANDLRNIPDTIFYGSSEEDFTSDFATELGAGGYLSIFFREAIDGYGDLDGDGVIMIGELTHFLKRRLIEEWVDPIGASWGYQELVAERGTVSQDTIFCWFTD